VAVVVAMCPTSISMIKRVVAGGIAQHGIHE
jgi:hypothetical protein